MDAVLELEITAGTEPGTYVVDVLRSVGGGEPTATFELDLDEILDRRAALEDSVLSSSVSARRIMSATEAAIQDVGRELFDAVFRGDVATAYRTSLAVASDRGGGIQVVLRLTAPGIAALPWEALFDGETGTYLCRKEPLVRHVPAPYTPPVLAVKPPLRILGMISSPRGLPPLDVDAEKELLEEALRPHLDAGRVQIDWIDQVTWTAVHDRLLEREWHVLHFIGHGTYDAETDEGVLAFVGRDGRADYVSASSLADLLDEAEPSPRLVLLNSCRSAAGSTDDLFSGTAAALVHSGIHAVAAMQFSISDTAAIEFARGFYAALAHGRGIDEAVRSGRIGILGITRGTLEWVTPVLYLRGEDTKLFDVAPMAETAVPAPATRPAQRPLAVPAATTLPPAASVASPAPPAAHVAAAPVVSGIATIPTTVRGSPPSATIPTVSPAAATGPPLPSPPPVRTSTTTAGVPTHPVPPPPSRPTPTPPPPRPARSRRAPWIVVGIVALIAIGGGIAAVRLLQPGGESGVETTDSPAAQTGPAPEPSRAAQQTAPLQTIVIPGTELEWVPTGVTCAPGEVLELTATGTILQGDSEDSRVGPGGWQGESPGYAGQFGFPPGALIGRLAGMVSEDGFAFTQDGSSVDHGTATFPCPIDGELELGISDPVVDDNSGEFSVSVWKSPSE